LRKTFWISQQKLKLHEFNSTLRILTGGEPNWFEKFKKIGELEKSAYTEASKYASALFVNYLLLNALNGNGKISVSFQSVSASVPTAYFSAATSLLYFVLTLSLIHLFATIVLRLDMAAKISTHGFSPNIVAFLNGRDENALSITHDSERYFTEVLPTRYLMNLAILLACALLLIPYFAFGYYLIVIQIDLLTSMSLSLMEKCSACAAAAMTALALCYLVIFHIPLPYKKTSS